MHHPIQPVEKDFHGVERFKANSIVRHLLDHSGIDMNALAMINFSNEDRQQFAQLIGYSVSGYGELSYVDQEDSEDVNLQRICDELSSLPPDLARSYMKMLEASAPVVYSRLSEFARENNLLRWWDWRDEVKK